MPTTDSLGSKTFVSNLACSVPQRAPPDYASLTVYPITGYAQPFFTTAVERIKDRVQILYIQMFSNFTLPATSRRHRASQRACLDLGLMVSEFYCEEEMTGHAYHAEYAVDVFQARNLDAPQPL